MARLLRIDSSSRLEYSHTRHLSDEFSRYWAQRHPGDEVVVRDIIRLPIEHIRQETITGFYTPPEHFTEELSQATALSDALIDEIQAADMIVISAPIYNFGVPSSLKAYIDQIVRINKTFSYDGTAFTGLLKPGKKAYLLCAYGGVGYGVGGAFASANFLEPYLKFVLEFLGVAEVHSIAVEATTADEATVEQNINAAKRRIAEVIG